MNHQDLYTKTTFECSKLITEYYSTSFTLGIKTLVKKYHYPVFAIYGFVRYADEIVDTFHNHNKKDLLKRFWQDTYQAIEEKISLNPVLHSFQLVVNEYKIERELIEAFLHSMEMDLEQTDYNDEAQYQQLREPARRLGSAFQKVNFLRDVKSDYEERGRVYFPGVNFNAFTKEIKKQIEADIQADFDAAYEGIIRLPKGARMGVYLAYQYYLRLFQKIKNLPASKILNERIRVPDFQKLILLGQTYLRFQFRWQLKV